jgi:UDP-glucose 6-dehydrogenase
MHVIVGMGEIGRPIYEHCKLSGPALGIDTDPSKVFSDDPALTEATYLHVCLPGTMPGFSDIVVEYANRFDVKCVIVHSTISPGTTDVLAKRLPEVECSMSPVHGKHITLYSELIKFPKIFGVSINSPDNGLTAKCLRMLKMKPKMLDNSFTAEWSKLLTTTWLGWAIAFHQEVERIALQYNLDEQELIGAFHFDSSDFRSPYYSGIIGGHCVMSNIEILQNYHPSEFWDLIVQSNTKKKGQS